MPDGLLDHDLGVKIVRNPDASDSALSQSDEFIPKRIVLTGFMGAGKSTVGRLLAERLRWDFVDADDAIQEAGGGSIAEIFARHGEPWFRELEHKTILRLAAGDCLVLALGGGAIEDVRTRDLLRTGSGTCLVHLEASLETGLRRCEGTEATRPVLANAVADRSAIQARYARRLPLYREAHHTVPVDSLAPEAVVDAVIRAVKMAPGTAL